MRLHVKEDAPEVGPLIALNFLIYHGDKEAYLQPLDTADVNVIRESYVIDDSGRYEINPDADESEKVSGILIEGDVEYMFRRASSLVNRDCQLANVNNHQSLVEGLEHAMVNNGVKLTPDNKAPAM